MPKCWWPTSSVRAFFIFIFIFYFFKKRERPSVCFGVGDVNEKTTIFFREFQPMTFAHDDSSLLLDQDTNRFLVLMKRGKVRASIAGLLILKKFTIVL